MVSISISDAVNTTSIQFHGQPLVTAMVSGVAYVAMRPIVENIGIDWSGQMAKLKNQIDKFGCRDISTPSKGGIQKMLCIPLRKLNGWLFSINPEKVRADIRDKLIQYQEECFAVLHEYWTKGEVTKKNKTRKSTATQLTPLRQTAERLITTGLGQIYPDIWKLVHQRFDIEHIQQLQPEQIGEAIEYLNTLEGEYIGKQTSHIPATYNFDFPLSWWDRHEHILKYNNCTDISLSTPWRFPVKMLFGFCDNAPSAISTLLFNLTKAGYDVSAACLEYLAHRHHAEIMYSQLERISELSQRAILR